MPHTMPVHPVVASAAQHASTRMVVVIINYNTREHLQACLATVEAAGAAEVVVVDNASTDGSVEMVRDRYPSVRLVINPDNPGYGAASNQAIVASTAGYILLLNSDTRLQPETLQVLSRYLDQHPRVAIVGPRLANPDGTLQPSCFYFPTPLITFLQVTIWGSLLASIPAFRNRHLFSWPHIHARAVPWLMGAVLAIRREAFETVAGFDPSFFMFSEEVDLCYRLQTAGWEVHFTPDTTVVHLGGASTRQRHITMEVQRYASTIQFYQNHYSRRRLVQLRLLYSYSMLRNSVRDSLRLALARRADKRAALLDNLAVWKQLFKLRW